MTETIKGIIPDLSMWDHYPDPSKIKDVMLREAASDIVSFVFRAQSHEGVCLKNVVAPPVVVVVEQDGHDCDDDDC